MLYAKLPHFLDQNGELPEYEDDRRRDYLLGKYFEGIFEEELNSWWLDPDDWPLSRRTIQYFLTQSSISNNFVVI
ncbi:MAG: hypothetical protein L6425_00580 [Candidatus Aminicenantes bacterium]|nr:hypothetical protein [Candidatus Aminicenantes bacterium]